MYLFESIFNIIIYEIRYFFGLSKAGEVLNWSMGLYLAFSGLSLIDNWTSAPNEGQGLITQAFATFQSSSMIQVIEAVALLATKLTMLEVFRRCLSRNKHFTAQFSGHRCDGPNVLDCCRIQSPYVLMHARGDEQRDIGSSFKQVLNVLNCLWPCTLRYQTSSSASN